MKDYVVVGVFIYMYFIYMYFLTYSAFTMLHLKKIKINSFSCFSRSYYGYNFIEVSKPHNVIDTRMHSEELPILKTTVCLPLHVSSLCGKMLWQSMLLYSCFMSLQEIGIFQCSKIQKQICF